MKRKIFLGSLILILFFLPTLIFSEAQPIQKGVSVTVTVPGAAPPPSGGVAPPLLPTKIVFEGKTSPNAFLTILKNKKVTATFLADDSGIFKRELTGLAEGKYVFEIISQDTKG